MESVDHLLLQCPIASEPRSMVFTLFGIHWVMPKTMVELLVCWQRKFGHHCNGVFWMVVPHCLIWLHLAGEIIGALDKNNRRSKIFLL